jgi:Kef-type K+ transport system membrane component KefB
MTLFVQNMLAEQSHAFNIILLIGIAIFGGTVGARIFQKLKVPQVIGYVVVGIVLGPIIGFIEPATLKALEPFNLFALGIIGFLVGGELKKEIFTKFGKQVAAILIFEGIMAFVLVGLSTFLVMWYFRDWKTALAVGVVFGAICAATDPASTISVLWEYKTRGPLTSMLTAIVTLDDALALTLYAISVSVAGVITGHHEGTFINALLAAFVEIAGSVAIGALIGVLLTWILKSVYDHEKILVFVIGTLTVCVGLAIQFHLDVILTTMAVGAIITNAKSKRPSTGFELMQKSIAVPVYALFFVLVGARLSFEHVDKMICMLVAAYVIGSIVGKTAGSYFGGLYSGAVKSVRNYLGLCLYPQGGIAIGLLIVASSRFDSDVSQLMLLVIIIGAFILQIIGPIGVKIGATKAKEIGLNITEQDLIKTYAVGDVIQKDVPVINSATPLSDVIEAVSTTDYFYYCVVDNDKKILGAITFDGLRRTFQTHELNDWLVALDIMDPVASTTIPEHQLAEAIDHMKDLDIEYLPVVTTHETNKYVGILDIRALHRHLSAEVFARQNEADKMYETAST